MKKYIPYLIVNALAFYLEPLIITDTGSAMFVVLIFLPLVCFLSSIIYGVKHSFSILYPVLISLLFIPTIFIHYNSSASIYIIMYGLIALCGNLFGKLFNWLLVVLIATKLQWELLLKKRLSKFIKCHYFINYIY